MDEKMVDFQSLEAFTGGDKDLMIIHISTFLDFAPAQLEQIKSMVRDKNWPETRNTAHKLKPKLTYMGIKSVIPLVETIESSAENETNLDQLPGLVAEVESKVQLAIEELKNFMNG